MPFFKIRKYQIGNSWFVDGGQQPCASIDKNGFFGTIRSRPQSNHLMSLGASSLDIGQNFGVEISQFDTSIKEEAKEH